MNHERLPFTVHHICEICYTPIILNSTAHKVVRRQDDGSYVYYHRTCFEDQQKAA